MKRRIVLLTNTCPFGGEVFLQNELKWIPHDQPVSLYPIFSGSKDAQTVSLNGNIEVQKIAS